MNGERKRILVVDDEPSIARLLKLNLEQTGDYEVVTENVSQAALPSAERFQPDLILLDVMMPGLDGGNLASRLRENPMFKGVPLVFLTAAVTREGLCERRGVVGGLPFLAKRVNLEEVLACQYYHLGLPRAPAAATGCQAVCRSASGCATSPGLPACQSRPWARPRCCPGPKRPVTASGAVTRSSESGKAFVERCTWPSKRNRCVGGLVRGIPAAQKQNICGVGNESLCWFFAVLGGMVPLTSHADTAFEPDN